MDTEPSVDAMSVEGFLGDSEGVVLVVERRG